MLPDFPKLKKDINENILTPAFERAQLGDALLSRIRHYIQHEGTTSSYQTVEGEIRQQPYQHFEGKYEISAEDILARGFDYSIEIVQKMGDEAGSQISKYSFEVINKTIDDIGNVVKTEGIFSKEGFLKAIEKIHIDFDEETGQPKLPSIYIHPNQSEAAKKMMAEAEADLTHKQRFDQIIEKKRKEWHDREAVRKLVD